MVRVDIADRKSLLHRRRGRCHETVGRRRRPRAIVSRTRRTRPAPFPGRNPTKHLASHLLHPSRQPPQPKIPAPPSSPPHPPERPKREPAHGIQPPRQIPQQPSRQRNPRPLPSRFPSPQRTRPRPDSGNLNPPPPRPPPPPSPPGTSASAPPSPPTRTPPSATRTPFSAEPRPRTNTGTLNESGSPVSRAGLAPPHGVDDDAVRLGRLQPVRQDLVPGPLPADPRLFNRCRRPGTTEPPVRIPQRWDLHDPGVHARGQSEIIGVDDQLFPRGQKSPSLMVRNFLGLARSSLPRDFNSRVAPLTSRTLRIDQQLSDGALSGVDLVDRAVVFAHEPSSRS